MPNQTGEPDEVVLVEVERSTLVELLAISTAISQIVLAGTPTRAAKRRAAEIENYVVHAESSTDIDHPKLMLLAETWAKELKLYLGLK